MWKTLKDYKISSLKRDPIRAVLIGMDSKEGSGVGMTI